MDEALQVDFDLRSITIDEEALGDGLSALSTLPLDRARLKVVIAEDLTSAAHAAGAESFRGPHSSVSGAVSGMVIATPGDAATVIINGRLLTKKAVRARPTDIARLFKHEGWHAVLVQRREHGRALVEEMRDSYAGGLHWIGLASEVLEEYRVELPLCREGSWAHNGDASNIDRVLTGLAQQLEKAADTSDDGRHHQLAGDLQDFFQRLGQLVAEDKVGHGKDTIASISERELWGRYVGPRWAGLSSSLDSAPAASDEAMREELEPILVEVAGLLEDWLPSLGISVKAVEEDGMAVIQFDTLVPNPPS